MESEGEKTHDFLERYPIEKSEKLGQYGWLAILLLTSFLSPLTLLLWTSRRIQESQEKPSFIRSLRGLEHIWKHICGYVQTDSCWCCQSVVGMGEGGRPDSKLNGEWENRQTSMGRPTLPGMSDLVSLESVIQLQNHVRLCGRAP